MRFGIVVWASLALSACGDEQPFLSLKGLCSELAVDVCEAREGCSCAPPDLAACQEAEQLRCEVALEPFLAEEGGLRYGAVHAARQREAVRDGLEACGPMPNLAQFFQGGLALGLPCERDAQCSSGRCGGEPRLCVEPTLAPICPAP